MRVRGRLGRGVLVGLVLLALLDSIIVAAGAAGFRINQTASMPMGLYRLHALGGEPLVRGLVVAVCPSGQALQVGSSRGYLRPGSCPGNVEPLLKRIEGEAGDTVGVSDDGVTVNGTRLAHSARVAQDCLARPVPRIPAGHYRVGTGKIWLYAPVPRSWDSRYFGPQSARDVVGVATPVLIVGEGTPCGG